jgi:hypothetical protein
MSPARLLLHALPLLALAGCGSDTSRSLGFTRDPPDEFQVQTRAPLSVPPRLGDLPTPTPGAPRPQDTRSAAGILAPGATTAAPSAAERALVAQAGGPVPDDIRRRVDEETLRLDRPSDGVVGRVMGFISPMPNPGAPIPVDSSREAQRLRENAALGRDVTDGDTPIVQPRTRTLWDWVTGG